MKSEKKFLDEKSDLAGAYVYCLNDTIEVTSYKDKKIYYNFTGNFQTSYYRHQENNGLFTFRMPKNVRPHNIKKMNFLNCQRSKISWGENWSRLGNTIMSAIHNDEIFVNYASNSTVCKWEKIQFPENKITVMWLKESWSNSVIRCNQYVWFNWFYYRDYYYIQIFYEQYVETWGSLVGGAIWINLGNELEIELF